MTRNVWMAFLFAGLACGCGGDPDEARTPTPRPAQECAPACTTDGPPPPPPLEATESTCFDGCNWCECTTDGPMNCTARLCTDAGV